MGRLIHTKDVELFNEIAAEVNELAGTACYYYRMDKAASSRKPLYNETTEPVFKNVPDGLRVVCFTANPEHSTTTGEEGRRTQWDATLWFARKTWEDTIREADELTPSDPVYPPAIGDVVNCWGEFFDVVDYDKDGIMDDQRLVFVLHKISLKRATKYEAWRRKLP